MGPEGRGEARLGKLDGREGEEPRSRLQATLRQGVWAKKHGQFREGQGVCVATGRHMKWGREVDQGWEAQRPQWRALRAKVSSRALDECTRNCTRMHLSHLLRPTRVGIRGTFWADLRSPAEAGQTHLSPRLQLLTKGDVPYPSSSTPHLIPFVPGA